MKTIQCIHYHLPQLKMDFKNEGDHEKTVMISDRYFGTIAIGRVIDNTDLTSKPVYVRGVSICAQNDQFVKKIGKNKAIGRMTKAAKTKTSAEPNQSDLVKLKKEFGIKTGWEYLEIIYTDSTNFGTKHLAYEILHPDVVTYFSQYDVELTRYEALHFQIADKIFKKFQTEENGSKTNFGYTSIIELQ